MNKSIVFVNTIILFFVCSCIDPFTPHVENIESQRYVVNGVITDQEGYQVVSISLTTQLENPKYIPLTDCDVKITVNDQDVLTLSEFEDGKYRVWIGSDNLITGTTYRLKIITQSGVEIESEVEKMPDCPDIDSVYYDREDLQTNDPNKNIKGIQFYIDLNGSNTDCRFYRWELDETYEYHVPYPAEYYYDGSLKRIHPPDYSKRICWKTQKIKNIFTLNTQNTVNNTYKRHPLNYVDNLTPRLQYGYSLQIKQYALSETAYVFWEQLSNNSNERGGLYETQPLPIRGNMINITNPNQKILGLFSASSVKSKRIFIRNVENLEIEYTPSCPLGYLKYGYKEIEQREYPAYVILIDDWPWLLEISCVDCRKMGGDIVKPEYWPY